MQIIRDDDVERLKKELILARKYLNQALSNRKMIEGRTPVFNADVILMAILSYIGGDQEDE